MTDESKQSVEGSLPPEPEPPRSKPRKGVKVEETPKEALPGADDAAASESSSHGSDAAEAAGDANPAERMRFRRIKRR